MNFRLFRWERVTFAKASLVQEESFLFGSKIIYKSKKNGKKKTRKKTKKLIKKNYRPRVRVSGNSDRKKIKTYIKIKIENQNY